MAQSSFQTIKDHWDEILSFLRENYNITEAEAPKRGLLCIY